MQSDFHGFRLWEKKNKIREKALYEGDTYKNSVFLALKSSRRNIISACSNAF